MRGWFATGQERGGGWWWIENRGKVERRGGDGFGGGERGRGAVRSDETDEDGG